MGQRQFTPLLIKGKSLVINSVLFFCFDKIFPVISYCKQTICTQKSGQKRDQVQNPYQRKTTGWNDEKTFPVWLGWPGSLECATPTTRARSTRETTLSRCSSSPTRWDTTLVWTRTERRMGICTGCLKKTEFYQIEHLEILLPVGKKYFWQIYSVFLDTLHIYWLKWQIQ